MKSPPKKKTLSSSCEKTWNLANTKISFYHPRCYTLVYGTNVAISEALTLYEEVNHSRHRSRCCMRNK